MTLAGRTFSDLVRSEASGVNLNATPKSGVLYVVNTAGGQVLFRESEIQPRRKNRWERLKQLAGGVQAASA
jgi:hypothetical protein